MFRCERGKRRRGKKGGRDAHARWECNRSDEECLEERGERWSGLGNTSRMADAYLRRLFFVQVTNRYSIFVKPTRYYALIVLPSPRYCIAALCQYCYCFLNLLLLSGDIEENPGPTTRSASSEIPGDILAALDEIRLNQDNLMKEMKAMQTTLSQNVKTFDDINQRLAKIEKECTAVGTLQADFEVIRSVTVKNSEQISQLTCSLDDSNDHARRNNLIFYGHTDSDRETWAQSEELIINLCKNTLKVTLNPRDIDRAHRLGSFHSNKNRPIIVKFTHFKDKDRILSNANKLKNTTYSISQDYSPNTRLIHKQLIAFGKAQSRPYKLAYRKLTIDKVTYILDPTTQTVVPRAP